MVIWWGGGVKLARRQDIAHSSLQQQGLLDWEIVHSRSLEVSCDIFRIYWIWGSSDCRGGCMDGDVRDTHLARAWRITWEVWFTQTFLYFYISYVQLYCWKLGCTSISNSSNCKYNNDMFIYGIPKRQTSSATNLGIQYTVA